MASIARHHAEWLSLLDIIGPFLSTPVLFDAFPQGLDAHDSDLASEQKEIEARYLEPTPRLFPVAITFVVPERMA